MLKWQISLLLLLFYWPYRKIIHIYISPKDVGFSVRLFWWKLLFLFIKDALNWSKVTVKTRAGRYTGSYRIPVFFFLTIWIFKIPQYRCHLNNVWNATLLERGLFSLLHFGKDTAVCVTKRERSETEAQVECDEREEVIHNIHIDRHKYPPSAASAPASLTI